MYSPSKHCPSPPPCHLTSTSLMSPNLVARSSFFEWLTFPALSACFLPCLCPFPDFFRVSCTLPCTFGSATDKYVSFIVRSVLIRAEKTHLFLITPYWTMCNTSYRRLSLFQWRLHGTNHLWHHFYSLWQFVEWYVTLLPRKYLCLAYHSFQQESIRIFWRGVLSMWLMCTSYLWWVPTHIHL